jgi:hypothetical protein
VRVTAGPTILHPIEKADIVPVEKGQKVGDWVADRQGWFLSNLYMKEVLDAKVERKKQAA